MTDDKIARRLELRGKEWQEAARAEREARKRRDRAMLAASDDGMSAAAIGRAVGLERSAAFRIINGERGPGLGAG